MQLLPLHVHHRIYHPGGNSRNMTHKNQRLVPGPCLVAPTAPRVDLVTHHSCANPRTRFEGGHIQRARATHSHGRTQLLSSPHTHCHTHARTRDFIRTAQLPDCAWCELDDLTSLCGLPAGDRFDLDRITLASWASLADRHETARLVTSVSGWVGELSSLSTF